MNENEGKEEDASRARGRSRQESGQARRKGGRQPQRDLALTRFLMPRLEGAGGGGRRRGEEVTEGEKGGKRILMIMFEVIRPFF